MRYSTAFMIVFAALGVSGPQVFAQDASGGLLLSTPSPVERLERIPSEEDAAAFGIAPALSAIRVLGVAPGLNGDNWERVPAGAISIPGHSSAKALRVLVVEVGYGTNRLAQFAGKIIQPYQIKPLCPSGGSLTEDCQAGMTIAGFSSYYLINPFTPGRFTAQATSQTGLSGTLSTTVELL